MFSDKWCLMCESKSWWICIKNIKIARTVKFWLARTVKFCVHVWIYHQILRFTLPFIISCSWMTSCSHTFQPRICVYEKRIFQLKSSSTHIYTVKVFYQFTLALPSIMVIALYITWNTAKKNMNICTWCNAFNDISAT